MFSSYTMSSDRYTVHRRDRDRASPHEGGHVQQFVLLISSYSLLGSDTISSALLDPHLINCIRTAGALILPLGLSLSTN